MFSHVMVGANDINASKKFYDAILDTLGVAPGRIDDKGRVFYMTKTGVFGISKPINGEAASAANGGTIGFAVDSPELGDAWHTTGVANGPWETSTSPICVILRAIKFVRKSVFIDGCIRFAKP